ncbi:potassium channel subfamily T member 1, partial [Elysia marginata]
VRPPPPRIVVSGPSPEMERKRRRRRSSDEDQGRTASSVFHLDSDSDSDSSDNPVHVDQSDRSVPVAYYSHELSLRGRLRRFFIRNSSTRVACTFFDMTLKSVMCAVYVVRVILDDLESYECAGSPCYSVKGENGTETNRPDGVNWYPVLWVQRSLALWLVEVTLAAISFAKAILMVYISTKNAAADVLKFPSGDFLCCAHALHLVTDSALAVEAVVLVAVLIIVIATAAAAFLALVVVLTIVIATVAALALAIVVFLTIVIATAAAVVLALVVVLTIVIATVAAVVLALVAVLTIVIVVSAIVIASAVVISTMVAAVTASVAILFIVVLAMAVVAAAIVVGVEAEACSYEFCHKEL